ncbi:MAG: discoidin domain-containing protein [Anaerolineae bacterium]|nr:discoidin domain-containing protein [Anaerolineae bacterium]
MSLLYRLQKNLLLLVVFSFLSIAILFNLMTISAQDDAAPTEQPFDIDAALAAMPIEIRPEDFQGECLPFGPYTISSYRRYFRDPLYRFDEHYAVVRIVNGGRRYNGRALAGIGMVGIRDWCEKHDLVGLQVAVHQADTLVERSVYYDNFATWVVDEGGRGGFMAPPGWTSALGNGLSIAFLTQLDALATSTDKYGDMAHLLVASYDVDVSEGGVRGDLPDGKGVLFQEVAFKEAPPGHILNGHMISVKGLAYYADHTGDPEAVRLVQEGIDGVRNTLEDYDVSTIASYSLAPIPWGSARTHYAHDIHINGLFWMYQRTQDPAFLEYALRWQRYKWPALPSDLYYDQISPETLRAHDPDSIRHTDSPVDTQSLILDLREVVPVRSFGYSAVGPYPVDYTLSVSTDGENWQAVEQVTDYDRRHNNLFLDDVPARYLRLSLDRMVEFDNPYYDILSDGFYKDRLMWGVIRADDATYWGKPVLLLTSGSETVNDTQFLQDNDPQTTLSLPADAVIYGDLRQPKSITQVQIAANSGDFTRQGWLEVSNDGINWDTVLPSTQVSLPGTIDIPAAEAYRYFRLHLTGDDAPEVSEVDIITLDS